LNSVKISTVMTGVLCGIVAAFGWAAGFVAAKHGVTVGFTPADLAMHRFLWTGLFLIVPVLRQGIGDLGGVGWGRGLIVLLLAGPPQSLLAYTGFTLVPLGHGTTIQPACAALFGLILATLMLREPMLPRRILGGAAIIVGLLVFGGESVTSIGAHGVGGDLLFVTAGIFWAVFGTLLRQWRMDGMRAVASVAALSVLFLAPLYFALIGTGNIIRLGLWENFIQIAVQGVLAGVLPIYLFARSVALLGAGRAATFPALVPVFGLLIGFAALGVVPTWPQLAGTALVIIGFRFALQ
jgi:drug/metabolite transporter (DMT)-like permease